MKTLINLNEPGENIEYVNVVLSLPLSFPTSLSRPSPGCAECTEMGSKSRHAWTLCAQYAVFRPSRQIGRWEMMDAACYEHAALMLGA